ncbi:MAG: helix-turn-helix domain-containing protein [bacterium]
MVIWIEKQAYLTASEACEILRVKPQTLYAYVSRGLLRSFRQGIRRRRLYLRREIEALVRLVPVRRQRTAREPRRVALPEAEDWVGDL